MVNFRGNFPKLGFFARFSLYIINFAGRIGVAAMGGAGGMGHLSVADLGCSVTK